MTPSQNTIYLERRTYRRRRMMDAARLLPVVGVLLFLVPLLWSPDESDPSATSTGVVYVFAIWAGLIVVSAWMSRTLGQGEINPDSLDSRK